MIPWLDRLFKGFRGSTKDIAPLVTTSFPPSEPTFSTWEGSKEKSSFAPPGPQVLWKGYTSSQPRPIPRSGPPEPLPYNISRRQGTSYPNRVGPTVPSLPSKVVSYSLP